MVGRTLKNRYRLQEAIGRGGMGVVYRAVDLLAGRSVAVKVLGNPANMLGASPRFRREARALSSLDHPNIVSVFDFGEEDGLGFIVMELLSGRSLRSFIPLSPLAATQIVIQICAALQYAHGKGIVHRDIKPENVMILEGADPSGDPDGSGLLAKVMDFGLATHLQERSHASDSGELVGTVAYLSPEQALGMRADVRSDLYSLGAVFYELLTAREVFPGRNLIAVIYQHLDEPPTPPRRHNPEVSPELERVILRLLQKEPSERFQSAGELLVALQETIAGPQPAVIPAPPSAKPPPGSNVFNTAFVGREGDLSLLRSRLQAASGSSGSLVLLGGEPGIGKTRLAHELLAYARLRRAQVLIGSCYEQEAGLPYQPFVDAIRVYIQTIGSQRPSVVAKASEGFERELTLLVPEIKFVVPVPEVTPLASGGDPERSRLFEAVRRFICRLGETSSVVLLLDDLQWADAGTLQLLHYIARQVSSERVLVLGTYRDTEPGSLLSMLMMQMSREKLFQPLILERLTQDEVARLIASLLGEADLADDLVSRIYRETEGNAFFVVETVQHLLEEGAIRLTGGRWRVAVASGPSIPLGVRDVVSRRLARLSPETQQVLGIAAVVGREFGFDTLLSVMDRSEDALLEAIEEALKARLIREKPLRRDDCYDFVHGKIREILYHGLSARRRKILHRSIGERLEALGEDKRDQVMGELTYHFAQAGETEKAIAYGLRAGDLALAVYATEDAARQFGEVVGLVDELGGHPRACEAKTKLGESYMILGRFGEALGAYQAALALVGGNPGDARIQLARLHDAIGLVHERLGHYDESLQHLSIGLQHLGPDDQTPDAARIFGHLAVVFSRKGRYTEAEDYSLRYLRMAEQMQNDEEIASACTILARLSSLRAEWDDASRYTARALAVWQRKNDVYRQASNYLNLGVNLWPLGRLQEAAQYWEMALKFSNDIRYATGQMQSHINLGNYFLTIGDTAQAGEHYRVALNLAENSGHSYYAARALMQLGQQHRAEGDLVGSASLLVRAKESLEAIGHAVALSEVLWNLAETMLAQGQLDEARACAERSLSLAEERESVEEIANAKRVLAGVYGRSGDAAKAHTLYQESLAAFGRLGDAYELARARLDFARFLLAQPDHSAEEVRALLEPAHATFVSLGVAREKREAASLLQGLSA